MTKPTQTQIDRCASMGWHHDGEGIFTRGQEIGYFTADGFVKE